MAGGMAGLDDGFRNAASAAFTLSSAFVLTFIRQSGPVFPRTPPFQAATFNES
jgi:hypothetical protein